MTLDSLWFIDGVDLWKTFSIALAEGSADFLRVAPRKASAEHDWGDADGVEVDLSRFFFQPREGALKFHIFADSTEEFFTQYDGFIALLTRPGLRRLELASHNNRSYYIHYKACSSYTQIQKLTPFFKTYKVAQTFTIDVREPRPKAYPSNQYLVTQNGKFIIA